MCILEALEAALAIGATLAIRGNSQLGTLPMVTSTVVCLLQFLWFYGVPSLNHYMQKIQSAILLLVGRRRPHQLHSEAHSAKKCSSWHT